MSGHVAVGKVISGLDRSGIKYMLVGSYSSNAYGIPRATNDADFVVELQPDSIRLLLAELGPEFQVESQIEFETVTGTIRRRLTYRPGDFEIELFEISRDTFDCQRFSRRVCAKSAELSAIVWLPTPEDVIIQKLRWSRDKDLTDVTSVIAMQREVMDWDYIRHWTHEHQSDSALERILKSL